MAWRCVESDCVPGAGSTAVARGGNDDDGDDDEASSAVVDGGKGPGISSPRTGRTRSRAVGRCL